MADYKLKIKVGEHEFEAEGPEEAVKSQFDAFRDLISGLPSTKKENSPTGTLPVSETPISPPTLNVDKIFRTEGRLISITAPPASETDAVLMILFGQRHYRNNDNATGSEIIDGMVQSGYRTPRIDRILSGLSDEGAVIITGAHRGKRYRLTNQGHTRAETIVKETLGKLP